MYPAETVVLRTPATPKHAADAVILDGVAAVRKIRRFSLLGDDRVVLLLSPHLSGADDPRRSYPLRARLDQKIKARQVVGVNVVRFHKNRLLLGEGQKSSGRGHVAGPCLDQAGRNTVRRVHRVPAHVRLAKERAVLKGVLADAALDLGDADL